MTSNRGSSPADWPTYLLWQLPLDLRKALVDESEARSLSLADVLREILCDEMGLDCEHPRRHRLPVQRTTPNGNLFLRLQPELLEALRETAVERETSVRALVLGILTAHYQEVLT